MPERYNNGYGSDRNLKNTDNEDTMYIPETDGNYYGNGQQPPPPRRQSRQNRQEGYPQQQPYQGQQYRQYGGYPEDPQQQYRQYSGYQGQQGQQRQQYRQYGGYQQQQQNYSENRQEPRYSRNSGSSNRSGYNSHSSGRASSPNRGGYASNSGNSNGSYPPPRRRQPQSSNQQRRRPQNDGGGYSNQPRRQQPAKNSRKHKSILGKVIRRIIFSLLTLFLLLFGIYSCTALSLIKKVNKEETDTRYHTAGAMEESYVHSVLIIGTDGRTLDDRGRSDTMILLSLNTKTDELIMTSFMRDCYVDIPNNGWDKLNAAYVYGGPSLLMDTIEKNFNVRIDDYVTINFNSFASIIDAVGGVDIDVSDEEASAVNDVLISEVNELMGDDRMDDLLTSGGKLHLNGKQALSYARIRYVNGGNDFERTQRQRTIVTAVINKAKSFKPSMLSDVASNVIPQVSTNMSTFDMYVYSIRLPFAVRYATKQVRIPAENTYSYGSAYLYGAEQSVLEVNFAANEQIIQDEVFSDKK